MHETTEHSIAMMPRLRFERISWLVRRLSRIYPAEIPYRIAAVFRAGMQSRGWFDARLPPTQAPDAVFARAWVQLPTNQPIAPLAPRAIADQILSLGVPVFDILVPLVDGVLDWNRDPKTLTAIDKSFGLAIDFRHIVGGVDIKYLWELNRHVWWVPLAQAYATSGDTHYLLALRKLLDSWLTECPYPLGANWSSPVEHGIRLINWSIVWHLIGGADSPMFTSMEGKALKARWMTSIYQHMRFASDNYSFYSSADNHLIGEAAGIFVGAHTWDLWDESRLLRSRAKEILEAEMVKQFTADGANMEQSLCYHRFSLEFMLAAILAGEANGDGFSDAFKSRMQLAIEFMAAMMDCNGRVPAIGDSDDGRVFAFVDDRASSPYESMLIAGAALLGSPSLTKKLQLLGKTHLVDRLWLTTRRGQGPAVCTISESELATHFPAGGYLIMGKFLHAQNEFRITMDIGPLGSNRIAGHGHADALSLLVSIAGREFLVDPGTYCYNAAPALRHYFRGTGAHNTALIDGTDQSIYGGSFLWLRDVNTTTHHVSDDGMVVTIDASHDGYMRLADPVKHTRTVVFRRHTLEILVEDRFECAKSHDCQLRWHFSPDCVLEGDGATWTATRDIGKLLLSVEAENLNVDVMAGGDNPPAGWYSNRFYEREPTHELVCSVVISSSAVVRTRFTFAPSDESFINAPPFD